MPSIRGEVIGTDSKNSKLIVYVGEMDAFVDPAWPEGLFVEAGSLVDLYDDGALSLPVTDSEEEEEEEEEYEENSPVPRGKKCVGCRYKLFSKSSINKGSNAHMLHTVPPTNSL